MDLFFNELSIEGRETISKDSVLALVEVYQALRKYEITTCRIDSINNQKLLQLIQDMPAFLNVRNFYFSFFVLHTNHKQLGHSRMNIYYMNGFIMASRALACH